MYPQLFFAAVLIASIELFFIGLVLSYFQAKLKAFDIFKLALVSVSAMLFLIVGSLFGKASVNFLAEKSSWFGATVLFILGLKLFYDKVKLSKLKLLINPLESKGLITLAVFMGINIFFVGLASGLLNTPFSYNYLAIMPLLGIALFGYFLGFRTKQLLSRRFEFLSGMLYLAIAIIIVSNI